MTAIGRLKDRITIQVWSQVTDPGGGVSEAWTDELTTWAEVKPLRSKRNAQDAQITLQEAYMIHLRWATGRILDKKRRIEFGDKVLTITGAIVIDEAKRFWEINALVNE